MVEKENSDSKNLLTVKDLLDQAIFCHDPTAPLRYGFVEHDEDGKKIFVEGVTENLDNA